MLRLKVYGPNTGGRFGPADVYLIDDPSTIGETASGRLTFRTVPTEGTPDEEFNGRTIPGRKATRGSWALYARGEWTRFVLTDIVEEDE
jgi:hypothetical protein